jgi:hypothetical protein
VWLVSGKDGSSLLDVCPAPAISGFAERLASGGDHDADGTKDLLVGCNSGRFPSGKRVLVLSGRKGEVVWSSDLGGSPSPWGAPSTFAPDENGDGGDEVLLGSLQTGSELGGGELVLVLSGRDGSVLRRLRTDQEQDLAAVELAIVGDLDGDASMELAVVTESTSERVRCPRRVLLFDMEDGKVRRTIDDGPVCGLRVVRPVGDHDGDGRPDLLLAANGGVRFVSGRTLRDLWSVDGSMVDEFGTRAAVLGDVSLDGRADVVVAAPNAVSYGGAVHVLSGRGGKLLHSADDVSLGVEEDVHHIGHALVALGDLDGDGAGDFATSGNNACGGLDNRVFVLSGRSGRLLFEFRRVGDDCVATRSWRAPSAGR